MLFTPGDRIVLRATDEIREGTVLESAHRTPPLPEFGRLNVVLALPDGMGALSPKTDV